MLFADDTGTWFGLAALAVSSVSGVIGLFVKTKYDAEMVILRKDNVDLKADHATCQTRLSAIETNHATAVALFGGKVQGLEAEVRRERDAADALEHFVAALFGELYSVGIKAERMADLQGQYRALTDRPVPK